MLKVVFDTNVIISGLIASAGAPHDVLETWRRGEVILLVCDAILKEVADVLARPFFREKRHITRTDIDRIIVALRMDSVMVARARRLHVIEDDPDDDRIVECAVEGGADYIVSGDHHLLELERYRDIQIVSAPAFLATLTSLRAEDPGNQ